LRGLYGLLQLFASRPEIAQHIVSWDTNHRAREARLVMALHSEMKSDRDALLEIVDRINEFALHPDVSASELAQNARPILEDCRGVLLGLLNNGS
jgi:hypothetical protein